MEVDIYIYIYVYIRIQIGSSQVNIFFRMVNLPTPQVT